ncbi:MAG: hypothetical protein K4304_12170 [Propionicimonas sp.]
MRPVLGRAVEDLASALNNGGAIIAATAHAHGARLYTRSADDSAGPKTLVDIIAG